VSDKTHEADAFVPSETDVFDQMGSQGQELTESQRLLAIQVQRVTQFAQAMLKQDNGPGMMILDAYIYRYLLRCQTQVLYDVAKEKLGFTDDELNERIAKELDSDLSLVQMLHKIIITPDGIIPADDNGKPKKVKSNVTKIRN